MERYREHQPASHGLRSPLTSSGRQSRPLSAYDALAGVIDGRGSSRRTSARASSQVPLKRTILSGAGLQNASALLDEESETNEDNDDDDRAPSEAEKTMTAVSGVVLLCKSMLGGGMFTLAYGSSQFGLVLAVVFLAGSFSLTWLSLKVLSQLALDFKALSPNSSLNFASMSFAILPRFSWVLDASLIIYCGGAIISYLTNIGNLFSLAFYNIAPWDLASFSRRDVSMIIRTVLLVFILPLCLLKQLGSTKFAAAFGLCCIFFIIIVIVIYSPCTAARTDMAPLLTPAGPFQMLATFPVMIFAYNCQFCVFHMVNELKNATSTRLNRVFVTALIICTTVYSLMLLPFLTFGTNVKQNVLFSLTKFDGSFEAPVIASLIFAALSLSISYVLLLLPVRISIMALAFGTRQPDGSRELRWRVFIVLCIVLVTFGTSALLGDNIALPIEIAGLLGGNTLGHVFPFILYLKHYGLKNDKQLLSVVVLVALIFCCLLYPICLYGTISKSRS